MSYFPAIPAPTDRPSISQGQMLSNFGTLNTVFGIDHVNYTSGTAAIPSGWHLQTTLRSVTPPAVDPATGLNRGIFYTKNTAAGNRTEPYYRYDSSALPAGGGSVIANVLPVKAFGLFVSNAGGAAVLLNSFNVTGINCALGATNVYTITFQQQLATANYAPLVLTTNSGATIDYNALAVGSFQIRTTGLAATISFAVLQYVP